MTQMVYGDLVNSKGIEWDKGCEFLSRIRWQTFNHLTFDFMEGALICCPR